MQYRKNSKKALEVVLWFANKEPGIDVHRLLKLLFFADKWHLNRYGRPIVGDNYCALQWGPAAMTTYDILERKPGLAEALGIEEGQFPFDVQPGPKRKHVHPLRPANERKLSESDRAALDWAYGTYGHLDFNTLSRLSHDHPAWQKGSKAPGTHMQYLDFLEGENLEAERIEELEELAQHLRC